MKNSNVGLIPMAMTISLAFAMGCSSGPSKSTSAQTPRQESPPAQASRKSPETASAPVASKPTEPLSQKSSNAPSPSSSEKMGRASVKPPTSTSPRKVTRKPHQRKKRQTAKQDNSLDALLGTSPTMTAQESSSGSSIRGLSPVSENYGKDHKISKDILDTVRRMEEFKVSDEELENFQKAGKLSPSGP